MLLGLTSKKRKSNGLASFTATQGKEIGKSLHFHFLSATHILHGFQKHFFASTFASVKQEPCSEDSKQSLTQIESFQQVQNKSFPMQHSEPPPAVHWPSACASNYPLILAFPHCHGPSHLRARTQSRSFVWGPWKPCTAGVCCSASKTPPPSKLGTRRTGAHS